ncbi:MAG: hypothetical protein NDI84_05640 [Steroidobacteraceae bacterium]|nr:hypothetical protein [Steroidobacteraceae bacterium]
MIVAAMRVLRLMDRYRKRRPAIVAMCHDAGDNRGLQPGGAEQPEHSPRKGALSSPDPSEAEVHAEHLS